MDLDPNYVIGRGKLYFDRFLSGTRTPTGELYFGNTPAFSTNTEAEELEHFSSEGGLKEQDAAVTLSQTSAAQFDTDNISGDNLALFFSGEKNTLSVDAVVDATQEVTLKRGHYYQMGETPERPFGRRDISAVALVVDSGYGKRASGTITVATNPTADDTLTINSHVITFKASGATGQQVNIGGTVAQTAENIATYINATVATGVTATVASNVVTVKAIARGTAGNSLTLAKSGAHPTISGATLAGGTQTIPADGNLDIDLGSGRVQVLHDAVDIEDGDTGDWTYSGDAIESEVVISKNQSIYGRLRFISNNPVGDNRMMYMPYVKITSNGDYNLKGDEWQQMSFSVSILKLNSTTERIYMEKLPPG